MLKIRGLRKRFGELAVLGGLDLDVGRDEIVAVIGPSGCGKSTLLNIVAGFVRPDGGEVDAPGARVGYVFQEDRLLPWRTVEENIALAGDTGVDDDVRALVAMVGLEGFEKYYPDALSGGMRQRCSIARAYHYRCDLLLMDEPFKSLDYALRFEMLAMLSEVRRRRRSSVLFVTHDVDDALAIANRLVVLGRRPARVLGEFRLGEAESMRDVLDPELSEIKREVVGLMM